MNDIKIIFVLNLIYLNNERYIILIYNQKSGIKFKKIVENRKLT